METNDPLVDKIIAEWGSSDRVAEISLYSAMTEESRVALARVAVTALRCGSAHPDRPSLVCTGYPHGECGPLYHRNETAQVEWWEVADGEVNTVHDVLGSIQLRVQAGRRQTGHDGSPADSGIRVCPFCGSTGTAEHAGHVGLTSEMFQCAECRSTWVTDSDVPIAPTDNDQREPSGESDADRYLQVLRDVLPVLRETGFELTVIADKYRSRNFRLRVEDCKSVERKATLAREAMTRIKDLLDTVSN